ncbi:MAG: CPBP family intramembrane glutamic endopeptidase [Acidobacteriota bacterium]
MPELIPLTRWLLAAALLAVLVARYPSFARRCARSVTGRLLLGLVVLVAILDLGSQGSLWQVSGAGLALGVYCLLVLTLEGRRPAEVLNAAWPKELVAGLVLGTLAGGIALVLAGRGMSPGMDTSLTFGLLAAAIFAGVCEEVLFRGILLRVSEEKLGSMVALALSAALFAWVHSKGHRTDTFFAGLALGACFLATRRLWLPIGGHVAHNFVLDLLSSGESRRIESALFGGWRTALPYLIFQLVVIGSLLIVAFRRDHIRPWVGRASPSS